MAELSDEELQRVYTWVDSIKLSRPKRNISRDFSDGVLAAEVVHSYFPRLVELHNYSAANSISQKQYNWKTLNDKVFRRLGFRVSQDDVEQVVRSRPGVIERVLLSMQAGLEAAKSGRVESRGRTPQGASRRRGKGKSRQQLPRRAGQAQSQSKSRNQPQAQQHAPARYEVHETGFAQGGMQAGMGMPQNQPRMTGQQAGYPPAVDLEMLEEKEQTIQELRETIDILELKVKKLEQLLRLKDSKITALTNKLQGGAM